MKGLTFIKRMKIHCRTRNPGMENELFSGQISGQNNKDIGIIICYIMVNIRGDPHCSRG